jgi:serine/threonine protein phosphatase PrpC
MLSIRAAALTDIGRVRRENEDRYLLDESGLLFGVADGVGGLPGGAEAAQAAIDDFARAMRALPAGGEPNLVALIRHTNEMVARLGQQISPSMGIGTTITVGYLRDQTLKIAHVGDSRCYAARGREFTRITEDHSVENEARLRRARGETVYYHEANRNALTRCIGQPALLEVDVISRPILAGDRLMFCTDGVTRMVPDSELGSMLMGPDNPKLAIDEIVRLAVRRGGPDNATAVGIFVDSL